jgi:hypothetical protein
MVGRLRAPSTCFELPPGGRVAQVALDLSPDTRLADQAVTLERAGTGVADVPRSAELPLCEAARGSADAA